MMRLPWFSRKQGEEEIARLEEKIDGLIHEMQSISIVVGQLKEDSEGKFEALDQELAQINENLMGLNKEEEDRDAQRDEMKALVEERLKGAAGAVEQMRKDFQAMEAEIASLKEGMEAISGRDEALSQAQAELTARLDEAMRETRHSLSRLFKGLNVVYRAGKKLEKRHEEDMEAFRERFDRLDAEVELLKADIREVKGSGKTGTAPPDEGGIRLREEGHVQEYQRARVEPGK
ncbi:MAG: hypothetical protein GXO65_05795 [Euryarchaeota archaeon]|nr:hypothetical protein [Euryarchaeota archaeon]